MTKSGFLWLTFALLGFAAPTGAEPIKGIYGIPAVGRADPKTYVSRLEKAGANAVFVRPDKETVGWFKKRGFQVYVSVNAFGGKGAWKRYTDSRPVKADGSFLGSREQNGGRSQLVNLLEPGSTGQAGFSGSIAPVNEPQYDLPDLRGKLRSSSP